jgi:alkaline phosphatase D
VAWYWRAPAKFLGNRSNLYRHSLSYDLKASGVSRETRDDLVLEGAGMTLVYDDPLPPGPTWSRRTVLLSEFGGWKKRTGMTRVPATRADLQSVLGALSGLEIRGGSGEAMAPAYLDNVFINQPVWVAASVFDPRFFVPGGFLMLVLARLYRRRREPEAQGTD